MTNMINRLIRSPWFPLGLQILTLGVFILLIAGGLAVNTSDMAYAKVLRNTNLANLIVWSYWWPLIILSAIFLGRVWCMVCPMEMVTSLAAKVGMRRKPPTFFRSGWIITGFFILILFIGIHTLAIHRVPFRMALYMILLLAVAIVSGLLFSRNTFCAHICPVGHLLGIYARLAPFGWGVRNKAVCRACKDKSCVSNKTAYELQGHSCGVGLYPETLGDNTQCLLCGHCLKACDRNNPGIEGRPNPGWFSRHWFADVLELKPFTASQAAFCLVLSGFVVYEVFTEWSVTNGLLLWLPVQIAQAFGVGDTWATGLVKSLTLFVGLPALLWLLPLAVFRLAGGRLPMNEYLLRFGIAFIPIMGAAHAVKALLKMTSRIPYWEYVVSDPIGEVTARGILNKTTDLSSLPAWRDPALTALSLVLMAAGVTLSLAVVRKLIIAHVPGAGWRRLPLYLIPGVYGGAFLVMLIAWRLF